jgi:hypothetical protein
MGVSILGNPHGNTRAFQGDLAYTLVVLTLSASSDETRGRQRVVHQRHPRQYCGNPMNELNKALESIKKAIGDHEKRLRYLEVLGVKV